MWFVYVHQGKCHGCNFWLCIVSVHAHIACTVHIHAHSASRTNTCAHACSHTPVLWCRHAFLTTTDLLHIDVVLKNQVTTYLLCTVKSSYEWSISLDSTQTMILACHSRSDLREDRHLPRNGAPVSDAWHAVCWLVEPSVERVARVRPLHPWPSSQRPTLSLHLLCLQAQEEGGG